MEIKLHGQSTYIYTAGKSLRTEQAGILFLHGAANDHSVWSWQSRWFAHHGYNALAVDLPGHGRSGGEALASVAQLADWAGELVAEIGLPVVHLVGHSMGSLIALELASRAPQSLGKLILIGCAVPMSVSDALLEAALKNEPEAIALITGWSHAPSTLLNGGQIPGMWLPGLGRSLMRRAGKGVLHRDLLNCAQYSEGIAAAQNTYCPCHLIIGERDLMTPYKATQELKSNLTNVSETNIAGAGHAMMNERPDSVLDAMRRFL